MRYDYNRDMSDELISVKQASQRLGITPARITTLIREGRLPAEKIGKTWVIRVRDLHLVEDRPVGNPNWRKKGGEKDE